MTSSTMTRSMGSGERKRSTNMRAGADVAQLGLDEGAEVAGRAVLHREDQVKIVVVLDNHARAHLRGGNRHRENP